MFDQNVPLVNLICVCARLSEDVYHGIAPDNIGLIGYERIVDEETSTFGMAYITDDQLIFSFMGSKERRDWLNDFKVIKTEFFGIRAHRGFAMCAGSVLTQVESVIKSFPDHKIVLTGHSLGGAIAALIAVALRPRHVTVITFGQPRVSTKAELLLGMFGEYIRVVNGSDLVPRSPWVAYSHAGTCLYLSNTGEAIVDPGVFTKLWDRLLTFSERARDHRMTDYIKELKRCVKF